MRVGSSSLENTALALVVGMVLAVVAWNHVRSTADEELPPSEKEAGEDEDPPANLTVNNAGTVSFPWEPSRSTSPTTMPGNAMQQQHHKDNSTKFQQEQEQQELHFLASMSFANGGLRTPTCRCCQ